MRAAASQLLTSGAAASAPSDGTKHARRHAMAIGPRCALLAPEPTSGFGRRRRRIRCRRRRPTSSPAVVLVSASASKSGGADWDDVAPAPTKENGDAAVPESIHLQRTRGEAAAASSAPPTPSSSSSSSSPLPPRGEGEREREGDPFRPGDLVDGRYRVEAVLGRGALGVTFAVRDEAEEGEEAAATSGAGEGQPEERLELALKATRLRGRGAAGWKAFDLAEREAQALKSLSGHPNIPRFRRFFDVDRPDDRVRCLVEERVRGGRPLSAVVAGGERASAAQVARVARDVLRALSHLASRSPPVTHRDVKPENIVLEGGRWGGGKAFLVDFSGVAAAALAASEDGGGDASSPSSSASSSSSAPSSASLPGPGTTVIGTFGFMAPEQFRGAASPASDVYALGATLLLALTGRQPSSFPLRRGLRLDVGPALEAARAPRLLRELVEAFLEPSAEDRPTADEALRVLEEALREEERGGGGEEGGGEEEEEEEGVVFSGRAFGKGERSAESARGGGGAVGLERGLFSSSSSSSSRSSSSSSSLVSPSSERGGSIASSSSSPSSLSLTRPPPGARSRISNRGKNFFAVDVPAGPLLAPERAGSAAFAVVWTASVAAWTVTALAAGSLLAAAFSIPFWLSGAAVARDALGGSLSGDSRLEIGPRTWRLVTGKKKRAEKGSPGNEAEEEEEEYDLSGAMEAEADEGGGGGGGGRAVGGETSTLRGARVAVTAYVNGVPRTRLELVDGFNVHVVSEDLSPQEQRWLGRAINAAVERATGRAPPLAAKNKRRRRRKSGEEEDDGDSDDDDDLGPPPPSRPPRVFISDSTWGPSGFGVGGMWDDDRFISGGGGGGGGFFDSGGDDDF